MNAGFVGEGQIANDGLGGGNWAVCGQRHAPADFRQLPGSNQRGGLGSDKQGHNDFFQGGVTRAFAEAADGDGERCGAGALGGEGVGGGHAEIVVAVELQEEFG